MTDTITLPTDRTAALRDTARAALRRCGADADRLPGAGRIPVVSPVTGEALVTVPLADSADVEAAVERAHAAFRQWRKVPAPVRGRGRCPASPRIGGPWPAGRTGPRGW